MGFASLGPVKAEREAAAERNYPGPWFKYENSKPFPTIPSSRFCRVSNPVTGIQKAASWEGGVRATDRETYSFFQEGWGRCRP